LPDDIPPFLDVAPLIAEMIRCFDARGMTQKQLAVASGVPEYTVSKILSGAARFPFYVELSMLLVHVGMTPNEAAALLGIWTDASSAASSGATEITTGWGVSWHSSTTLTSPAAAWLP
jgi:hypothetical protein